MNYLTEARSLCVNGVKKHNSFPKHMTDSAIEIIQAHFESLSKALAAIELTYLRSKQQ